MKTENIECTSDGKSAFAIRLHRLIEDRPHRSRVDRNGECETLKKLNAELEKEIQRLAALISAGNPSCSPGPWCGRCEYSGHDEAEVTEYLPDPMCGVHKHTAAIGGSVVYYTKHLRDVHPNLRPEASDCLK